MQWVKPPQAISARSDEGCPDGPKARNGPKLNGTKGNQPESQMGKNDVRRPDRGQAQPRVVGGKNEEKLTRAKTIRIKSE